MYSVPFICGHVVGSVVAVEDGDGASDVALFPQLPSLQPAPRRTDEGHAITYPSFFRLKLYTPIIPHASPPIARATSKIPTTVQKIQD